MAFLSRMSSTLHLKSQCLGYAGRLVIMKRTGLFLAKRESDDITFFFFPVRPWLHDDLDAWIKRQKNMPYKCAAIFIDNSGCDVVLGIIPFARELLARGTRVSRICFFKFSY